MEAITDNNNIIIENNSVQEMINSMHNPSLVNQEESPNNNWIYHLYSDGEITHQKGGWAYCQRSEFTDKYPITGYKGSFIFPIKRNNNIYYAIMTRENAIKIRDIMIVLNNENVGYLN